MSKEEISCDSLKNGDLFSQSSTGESVLEFVGHDHQWIDCIYKGKHGDKMIKVYPHNRRVYKIN